MTLPYTLEIGKSYQFIFRAQAILGVGMQNAVVQGLVDYETAQRYQDVDGIHASVLPELPAGTPQDAKQLVYVKVRAGENQSRMLAMDWIAAQPVEQSSVSQVVTVANCPPSRLPLLASALRAYGFDEFTFS